MPISDFKIPPFKYFPTQLLETQGPKQWARIRFLQACDRLKIPQDQWPEFDGLSLTPDYEQSIEKVDPFFLPPFQMLYETEAEWRDRAREKFEKFLEVHAADFRMMFQAHLDSGRLSKIKPIRGTAPIELRFEWAVRRHCLKEQFKEMSSNTHNAEQIRKIVTAILRETGLRK